MKTEIDPKKALSISVTALYLLFAAWLVLPFIGRNPGGASVYRLFVGLMLMLVFVGKSLWDVLAPQGLAKKVSNVKAIALVALALVITGFIIFTIARATAYYLDASIGVDSANFLP